jgi:hypothetical protein
MFKTLGKGYELKGGTKIPVTNTSIAATIKFLLTTSLGATTLLRRTICNE